MEVDDLNDFIKAVTPVLQILVPVVLTYIAYLQFAKKSKHDETHDLIEGYKQQIASLQKQLNDMYQKFLSSEKLVDEQRRELNKRKKDDE
jgi:gas vesicle protein